MRKNQGKLRLHRETVGELAGRERLNKVAGGESFQGTCTCWSNCFCSAGSAQCANSNNSDCHTCYVCF